ncbi:MAG: aminotransferase class V-fold PLP-dependent enzyme [Oscillospiraceae bacterium]|nr:aminotransferase class V-fold PLP-dependent enzyme [Oscillospiraceae bacterium]
MLNQKLIDEEYGFLGDAIFLNVSQVVMPPKRVQDAYRRFMDDYVANFGMDVVSRAWDIVNNARPKLQKLIGAKEAHEIAFVKNTAEGISILANGLTYHEGDNIVIADQEHQSVLFPWIAVHEHYGVELKIVKSVNREIPTEDMIAAIDEHTRVLIVSAVQFSTGFCSDLKRLGEACREKGVIFAVDGIQALGRLQLNVQDCHIDWLAAGSNKGLLGTLGAGFVYCSDRIVKDIIPCYAGYQSTVSHVAPPSVTTEFDHLEWYPHARRFESGNLSYNCIEAISNGVDLILELGIENIDAHIRKLEKHLREQISDLSLPVVQAEDEKHWGGVICVYYPAEHEDDVVRILQSHNIYCTMRGGYIRFGLEFYNTLEQMDIVSATLHEIDAINKEK